MKMTDADQQRIEFIKSKINIIKDHPKPGIVFRDLFSALKYGDVCVAIKELFINYIKNNFPDVEIVVGLEARGFLFSFMIASELGIGCVPVRKKGKLPGETHLVEYALDYGTDAFEIQRGSILPGQKVLIIDDLIATGGSINAAIKLIKETGCEVQAALVLMEKCFMNGVKNVQVPVHSFIKYDS